MHSFEKFLSKAVSPDKVLVKHNTITLADVEERAEQHSGIDGCLSWFNTYTPMSPFNKDYATPLISICSTGFIDTKHTFQAMKYPAILTKERNILRNCKGAVVLYCTSKNLKQVFKAKK